MPDSHPLPPRTPGPAANLRSRKTPAVTLIDTEAQVDMRQVRGYRLARVRAGLKARDYSACVLYDPINIRYATGTRNMTVWCMHNAVRYCFIPAEGPVTLFDFHNCEHLSAGIETVDEVRHATSWFFFGAGPRSQERSKVWAAEIADLIRAHGGGNTRLAMDHCDPYGVSALAEHGISVHDGQEVLERARAIKSDDELALMNVAIGVCEVGMARMRAALEPGMSENEIWSILHQTNIAMGGEWIETRLLASGGRTNPWFQESSDRIIRPGELLSFDTDLIGPFGYCADISRTYFCGPGRPSDEQRRLYRMAWDQIHTNIDILKAGITFRELSEKSFKLPERSAPLRYSVVYHGVGMADEYPHCAYLEDLESSGYDGVVEAGMTLCVESYIGEVGGAEGVKLEQQVLVIDTGVELLSTYPFEDDLLMREI